jgi:protein dithiol oxidoreductase (disulfide-forming)
MKRRDFTLAATAGLPLWARAQGPAPAKPAPQEGIEYVTLDKRVPAESNDGKIEVIEFFWYSCPHCNAFEPRFAQWLKTTPKDVVVRRVPVRFRDDFEPQQRMFYTLEAMGKLEALHVKLFTAIHGDKQKLDTFDTLSAWAVKNGLDKAKFTEIFNSFGVATKARRATQLQEAFKVQGVPSLGIAGRFYTDGTLASSMESALAVTEYLIGQVRKGR